MVEIPAEKAKSWARWLRTTAERVEASAAGSLVVDESRCRVLADLLDPQPPTLREQVADMLRVGAGPEYGTNEAVADAVLAVVADWLAAQPMPYPDVVTRGQRDHDVRLLRGGSDV